MIALLFLFFGLGGARAEELRMDLNEQRKLQLAPLATITHSSLRFENVEPSDFSESATGVEIGIRIYSISVSNHTFLAGFDIRQRLAERGLFETKAGIHLEYLFNPNLSMQGGWSFGDTAILRSRDLQFNGTSGVFGFKYTLPRVQLFAEYSFGGFSEGPGFIYILRNSGPQKLTMQTFAIGIEVPL